MPGNSPILGRDNIPKKKIDIRPVLGAAVVFLIIGAIIAGAAYFAILKPSAEALEASKTSAQTKVSTLENLSTTAAMAAASSYRTQIKSAGSTAAVNSIVAEMNSAIAREQKRKELLTLANTAADGIYYSYDNISGKTQSTILVTLKSELETAINAITSIDGLTSYQDGEFNTTATSRWRELHTAVVAGLTGTRVSVTIGDPLYGEFQAMDNTTAYIGAFDWTVLRTLKIGEATVQIPVKDTLERTMSIKENNTVKVYVYDKTLENTSLLFSNAGVAYVVYSDSSLGSVAWSRAVGSSTAQTYTMNVWETLKAAASGSTDAAAISLNNYGETVVSNALNANVAKYDTDVIYVIEVSDEVAEELAKAEFQLTDKLDVILVLSL